MEEGGKRYFDCKILLSYSKGGFFRSEEGRFPLKKPLLSSSNEAITEGECGRLITCMKEEGIFLSLFFFSSIAQPFCVWSSLLLGEVFLGGRQVGGMWRRRPKF